MSRAFVIRPFGTKKDSSGKEFDFERVHDQLIKPALEANDLEGGTTGEIIDSGNIRDDMFQLILEADLIVCDITANNANVFYELGIRHALRKKRTVLIKGSPTVDKTPFDLLTDRYLAYDVVEPANSVDDLSNTIMASMRSDRPTDSPIFQMLSNLPEANPEEVQVMPPDFREDVRRAAASNAKGWLRLLSDEVSGLRFERGGLKLVAAAQWKAKDYEGARDSWERIRNNYPNDIDANLALANIYERQSRGGTLELLEKSDQALERTLANKGVKPKQVAEALALKGRNQKTHWRQDFANADNVEKRRTLALSRALIQSYESYFDAFMEDLNHFYSGLAALQMGSILFDLASEDGWEETFDDDRAAENYRLDLEEVVTSLKALVPLSVEAALRKLNERSDEYKWARITEADVLFLTSDKERRIRKAYRDAIPTDSPFYWDAAKGQLQLFEELGFKADLAKTVISDVEGQLQHREAEKSRPKHVVIFAGHQIDEPDRPRPRFPADKEARAKSLIQDAMNELLDDTYDSIGLASASPGADILWHEVCADLGLKTIICLPMPEKDHARLVFKDLDSWRSRFLKLAHEEDRSVLTLSDRAALPRWLTDDIDPWARGNEWVVKMALTAGAKKVSLVVFWDGKSEGAAPAGTAHVVQLARDAATVHIHRIDSTQL